MTEGIVFVVCGEKAETEYSGALKALDYSGNTYPVQRCGRDYGAVNKPASRQAKVTAFTWSSYNHWVYMDADTRARESLAPLFAILADGWDVVMAVDGNQDKSVFWHVNEGEREMTLQELAVVPLQLQCGIMGVAKNERTAQLFQAWGWPWQRPGMAARSGPSRSLCRQAR